MTVRMRKHSQLGGREAHHQRRSDGCSTQPASVSFRVCADEQLLASGIDCHVEIAASVLGGDEFADEADVTRTDLVE